VFNDVISDVYDFWASTKSDIAREALDRIGKLYDIERDINGQTADVRHASRQKLSQSKVTVMRCAICDFHLVPVSEASVRHTRQRVIVGECRAAAEVHPDTRE